MPPAKPYCSTRPLYRRTTIASTGWCLLLVSSWAARSSGSYRAGRVWRVGLGRFGQNDVKCSREPPSAGSCKGAPARSSAGACGREEAARGLTKADKQAALSQPGKAVERERIGGNWKKGAETYPSSTKQHVQTDALQPTCRPPGDRSARNEAPLNSTNWPGSTCPASQAPSRPPTPWKKSTVRQRGGGICGGPRGAEGLVTRRARRQASVREGEATLPACGLHLKACGVPPRPDRTFEPNQPGKGVAPDP